MSNEESFHIVSYEESHFIDYQYKMMRKFRINHMIPIANICEENKHLLYYDIGGKISLPRLLLESTFAYEVIKSLLEGMIQVSLQLKDHLLSLKNLNLQADSIYYDYKLKQFFYIYLPIRQKHNKSFMQQFFELIQYLVDKIDQADYRAVSLLHRLCIIRENERFDLEQLPNILIDVEAAFKQKQMAQIKDPVKMSFFRRLLAGKKPQTI